MFSTQDNVAKIKCPVLNCGWELIWHQFGMWIDKKVYCEKCGTLANIKPAMLRDMHRLGGRHVIPESRQTHYDKNGVRRTIRLF